MAVELRRSERTRLIFDGGLSEAMVTALVGGLYPSKTAGLFNDLGVTPHVPGLEGIKPSKDRPLEHFEAAITAADTEAIKAAVKRGEVDKAHSLAAERRHAVARVLAAAGITGALAGEAIGYGSRRNAFANPERKAAKFLGMLGVDGDFTPPKAKRALTGSGWTRGAGGFGTKAIGGPVAGRIAATEPPRDNGARLAEVDALLKAGSITAEEHTAIRGVIIDAMMGR